MGVLLFYIYIYLGTNLLRVVLVDVTDCWDRVRCTRQLACQYRCSCCEYRHMCCMVFTCLLDETSPRELCCVSNNLKVYKAISYKFSEKKPESFRKKYVT